MSLSLLNPRNWKSRFDDFRLTRESNARARQAAKEAREEAAELERLIKVNEAKKSAARARSAAARLKAKELAEAERSAAEYERAKEVAMRPLEVGGPARIPKDADDFEEVCAEFSRLIFKDAKRTPKGPDGGIDVIGKKLVGQAKFHPSKMVVGADVRALAGSRQEKNVKFALFFHYGPGYSSDAIAAARKLDVILFSLDVDKKRFRRIK